jgi:periplasmic divalent cation tolerance protein
MKKNSPIPLLVFTTVAKKRDAEKIAKALLDQKLAACVTTLAPAESRYVWKEKVCIDREYVLMIKTLDRLFPRLQKALKALHPYECPEIIGMRSNRIAPDYYRWLTKNVR